MTESVASAVELFIAHKRAHGRKYHIRDAIVSESHRAATGEPDRLVLHALPPTIHGHDRPYMRASTGDRRSRPQADWEPLDSGD